MASIPTNRSNVIYGDSNVQTATVVPTLNDAADGKSLSVVSNIEDLNTHQKLTLQDLIYDTRTSEDYPQNQSNNIVAFVGTTQNWQLPGENVLEIDAQMTFNFSPNGNDLVSGSAVLLFPNPFGSAATQGLATQKQVDFNYGYWNQPEFCMLAPMTRFEVKMGSNNQVMGRYVMNYLPGILHNAKNRRYIPEEIDYIANIGLPMSRTGYNQAYNTSLLTISSNVPANGFQTDQRDFCDKFSQKILDIYQVAYLAGIAAATTKPANLKVNLLSTNFGTPQFSLTTNFKLPIQLTSLNSALCTQGYLPPGLPFRYELEYQSNPILIMSNSNDPGELPSTDAALAGFIQNITLQYPNSSNMTSSSGGNFKIIRREHMLRQSAQEQINVSWIQSPMLYQYETFEYYDLNQVVNGTNTFFSQEIAISQQRPTQLYLTCMYQGNPYTTQTYASGTTGISLEALNFNNATAGGFRFTEIKVYISGRQNYYLRTAYAQNGQSAYLNGSSGIMKDATNTLESIVNTSTYQNGDESNIAKTKMWTMSEGTFVCISINPGDMQKSAFMSSDQGASVIKMEFYGTDTFGNPIPSTYKIRVYKKLPEMFQIDAQKNITTVIWPAAVSQNKYVIPTTYNLN